jgi:hypothetical protein
MRTSGLAFLLSLGMAQGASFAGVEPSAAVITSEDPCPNPGATGLCTTVVTREEFERLTEALEPGMSSKQRLAVAKALVRIRRMAAEAQLRGLDRTSAFPLEMEYARMQLLSQDLTRVLRAEANDVADTAVDEYYDTHAESFESATFARIFVPHGEATESLREARELRDRAASGEDPDRLQVIAFAGAGITESSVNTKIDDVRKTALPLAHEGAFDLRPGEVSSVFSDPGGGYFIYKMLSRRSMTRDEARAEIRKLLAEQRYRDATKGFEGGLTFNDAYFNPPEVHEAPLQGVHRKRVSGSADR